MYNEPYLLFIYCLLSIVHFNVSMNLQYQLHEALPPEPALSGLIELLATIFTNQTTPEIRADLADQQSRTGVQAQLALHEGIVVGCKLGYARKPKGYYSWLGGVHPDFRGLGIASELMRQQHNWCRTHGYTSIQTQTYNQWRSMLILNLRQGFTIVGTLQGKRGLAIVLEKELL